MAMDSPSGRYSQRVSGSPIQKSPDLSLLAAPRSLSQLATSFFSLWHLGIHPALFTIYSYKHSIIDSFNCAWLISESDHLKRPFVGCFFIGYYFQLACTFRYPSPQRGRLIYHTLILKSTTFLSFLLFCKLKK